MLKENKCYLLVAGRRSTDNIILILNILTFAFTILLSADFLLWHNICHLKRFLKSQGYNLSSADKNVRQKMTVTNNPSGLPRVTGQKLVT